MSTHSLLARLSLVLLLLFAAPPATAYASQGAEGGAPADAQEREEEAVKNGIESAKEELQRGLQAFLDDPSGTAKNWLMEDGPRIGGRVALFLLLLFLARVLSRFVGRVVRRALDKSAKNASELLKTFIENAISKVIFFIGFVLALQNLGIDIAPLLAGIGVLGFVVGFALQDTLGNFAAGIMLLMYRPYDVGDFVEVAGREGSVNAMTLVSTTLMTPDNQRLTIPNGSIWGGVIRNVTANPTRRFTETVGIGYGDDIDRAKEIALEVLEKIETVHGDPGPQVLVTGLGDSAVNLALRGWVDTSDYFGTCCEVRHRIKNAYDEAGISIPYPQRDVHMHSVEG
ncbi:MAG: mechanosensitive ion channel family protein [Planctomycetota bacterium]|nr:mechanosensitive ion channel family protein [Planctomycetota bacterium]